MKPLPPISSQLPMHSDTWSRQDAPKAALGFHLSSFQTVPAFLRATRSRTGIPRGRRGPESPGLTLFMYSLSRSWSAWRTALHSATIRSRRSSRVHEESAMRAAPLMMLSRRSSRDGRNRASLNVMGSRMILFWKEDSAKTISREEAAALAPCFLNQKFLRPGQDFAWRRNGLLG